jgi:hypothetical protein
VRVVLFNFVTLAKHKVKDFEEYADIFKHVGLPTIYKIILINIYFALVI